MTNETTTCQCPTYIDLGDCRHTDPDFFQTEAYCSCEWDNPCGLCQTEEE
jgi:hypothetical protein